MAWSSPPRPRTSPSSAASCSICCCRTTAAIASSASRPEGAACRSSPTATRSRTRRTRERLASIPPARTRPSSPTTRQPLHPLRTLRLGLRRGPAVQRPGLRRARLRPVDHDLVRALDGRDRLRDVRQLRLRVPDGRAAWTSSAASGPRPAPPRPSTPSAPSAAAAARPAAGQGRPRRAGHVRDRRGARRGQPVRQGPVRVPVHRTPGPADARRSCAATASSCRRPGTRPSTSSRERLRRGQGRARPGRARRLLVGALHQRGELPLPEVHARRDRHAERRPLRAALPRLDGDRSGSSRSAAAR